MGNGGGTGDSFLFRWWGCGPQRGRRSRRSDEVGGRRVYAPHFYHLTVEARNKPAITALRLLAVLNVGFKYARIIQEMRRRAARALY